MGLDVETQTDSKTNTISPVIKRVSQNARRNLTNDELSKEIVEAYLRNHFPTILSCIHVFLVSASALAGLALHIVCLVNQDKINYYYMISGICATLLYFIMVISVFILSRSYFLFQKENKK